MSVDFMISFDTADKVAQDQIRYHKSNQSRHRSQWVSISRFHSTEMTNEHISVKISRQSRLMSPSGSINVDRVDTWVDHVHSQSKESTHERIFFKTVDRVNTWANRGRSRSKESTNKRIRIDISRHCRQMRRRGSITVDKVAQDPIRYHKSNQSRHRSQWVSISRFHSTEMTNEHIRVKFSRQSRHMSPSGSINVDRVDKESIMFYHSRNSRRRSKSFSKTVDRIDTSANRRRSRSTKSTYKMIRVDLSRHSRQMRRRGSITVDKVAQDQIRFNKSHHKRHRSQWVSISWFHSTQPTKSHKIKSGTIKVTRFNTGANECRFHNFIRQSRQMSTTVSKSVDKVDLWAPQGRSMLSDSIHESIMFILSRKSRHMSQSFSKTVDRVNTWANRGRSRSIDSTNKRIRIDISRHCRQMRRRGSITVDKVAQDPIRYHKSNQSGHRSQWVSISRFHSTEMTNEHIRVKFSRQSWHMSPSGSINVDRVDTWVDHVQSQSK